MGWIMKLSVFDVNVITDCPEKCLINTELSDKVLLHYYKTLNGLSSYSKYCFWSKPFNPKTQMWSKVDERVLKR